MMPIYAEIEIIFLYTNMHKSFIYCLMKDRVAPRRKKIDLCTEIASRLHVKFISSYKVTARH